MKYFLLFLCCCISVGIDLCAQAKTRKLSSSINHPSLNLYAPYISADANAMVFISDNAEDNALTPFYTMREATDWREPQMLPRNIYTRLNFLRGYSLSADGKRIYLATTKQPGVGGFDIVYSDIKGTSWTEPVNLGAPINTKSHEACASISTDGNTMYFMRCEKMDANTADNCKIFKVVKKSNGQWDVPAELPSNINTGNSQAPRIMADGETLIFSSNKIPSGKGGMDLYVTRFNGTSWSNPVALDFVNTEKDDQYVSVAALGRYLLKDTQGQRKNELVEFLIPDELRPKGMMKVEGKVSDNNGTYVPAYIAAVDLKTGKRFYNGRPGSDGSFLLYLKEGTQYEFTIEPEQNHLSYFSKILDLTSDKIPQSEKLNAVIKPVDANQEFNLELVKFKPSSAELDMTSSASELKRLARAINGNPNLKFEIQVLMQGYQEDSVQSSPDLTEVIVDSVHAQYETIDSLGQLVLRDTVLVKTMYHNDRTVKQAEAIISQLTALNVNRDRLKFFVNSIPAQLPESRKLTIKAVARN